MELILGLHKIQPDQQRCAATIGNFDGVHLGHQHLFDTVRQQASQLQIPSCVVTFEPLPVEYFASAEKRSARLMYLREKYLAIKNCGIDQLLVLPFNRSLADTEAEDFIKNVLVDGLAVRHLTIGDDFRFGKGRKGDIAMLKDAGTEHQFNVVQASTFLHQQQRVSSTRIRSLLQDGNLPETSTLLGRHYALQGRVIYGQQLGRTLDFPTANINLQGRNPPLRGVFVVEIEKLPDSPADAAFSKRQYGIANLGNKPTINGSRVSLEVHLLDFPLFDGESLANNSANSPENYSSESKGNLYGSRLRVSFLASLRDEKKFSSLDQLKQAIKDDEISARQWLKANHLHNI